MIELLALIILIFILVYKYLEYYNVKTNDAINVSFIMCFLVMIIFLFQNRDQLQLIYNPIFSEDFGVCKTDELKLPYLEIKIKLFV